MRRQYRFYSFLYFLTSISFALFYRIRRIGLQNIPEGPAVFCATHSGYSDILIMGLAVKRKNHLHMMAKAELMKNIFTRKIIQWAGSFAVDRGKKDIAAIKTALSYLKQGEKILIFPEGTRVSEDNSVAAKTGALRIAEKAGVPIVPVYIPRKKSIWHRIPIVIGEPFFVNQEKCRLTAEDYTLLAEDMMKRIYALKPGGAV